jgi:hypothetical protein
MLGCEENLTSTQHQSFRIAERARSEIESLTSLQSLRCS